MSSDTVLKNYWSGNEEFADLFNAVLFGGSQIIRADELENEDTEDSVVLEHRKQAEGVKAAIQEKNALSLKTVRSILRYCPI